jgi:hypothetical protein
LEDTNSIGGGGGGGDDDMLDIGLGLGDDSMIGDEGDMDNGENDASAALLLDISDETHTGGGGSGGGGGGSSSAPPSHQRQLLITLASKSLISPTKSSSCWSQWGSSGTVFF